MEKSWSFSRHAGREIVEALIEFLILGVIFVIPLWFAYFFPTYNIFEFNKLAVLSFFLWPLVFLTSWRLLVWRPRLSVSGGKFFRRFLLAPSIFILGLAILLLFSSDPVRSFYGTIERQQGLASQLFYFLWFLILTVHFWGESGRVKMRRAVTAAAFSATLVALYGCLQYLGVDFISWPQPPYLTKRTFSSLGQPNFLASWLLLVGPLSWYLFKQAKTFLAQAFWLGALIVQLVCLFLSGSRGGLIGLLLMGLAAGLYWFARSTWPRWRKLFLALAILMLAALSIISFDFISGGRIREMQDITRGSLAARLYIYQAAISGWQASPWVGYGLENSENVFIRYYSRDWGVYGDVGQTADRAHNLALDHLLTGGLTELALFILLLAFFFHLWRKASRVAGEDRLPWALFLGACGYFASLLVGFTIVTGEIYFWFFLACLVAISARGKAEYTVTADRSRYSKMLAALALLLVLVLAAWGIARQARNVAADHYFQKIFISLGEKEYFTALVLDEYLQEQRVNPVYQEAYDVIFVAALSDAYAEITELPVQQALRGKLAMVRQTMTPRDHQARLSQARISRLLGDYGRAEEQLQEIITLTPGWPASYYEQGLLRLTAGNPAGAVSSLDKALERLPEISDPRLNEEHYRDVAYHRYLAYRRRAEAYYELGDYEAAARDYESAYLSNPSDYTILKKIGDAHYARGDLEAAIKYSERGRLRQPQDYAWSLALAALYREKGDQEKANQYFQAAVRLAPDNEDLIRLQPDYQ